MRLISGSLRGVIEDSIITDLKKASVGTTLGGATGSQRCYMDFVIYDGDNSIDIIKRALKRHQVPVNTTLHYFTADQPSTPTPL